MAQRILLTGAAGHIGSAFRKYAGDRYNLRLGVHHQPDVVDAQQVGEVVPKEVEQGLDDGVLEVEGPDGGAIGKVDGDRVLPAVLRPT